MPFRPLNAGVLSTGPVETNFSMILIKIRQVHSRIYEFKIVVSKTAAIFIQVSKC